MRKKEKSPAWETGDFGRKRLDLHSEKGLNDPRGPDCSEMKQGVFSRMSGMTMRRMCACLLLAAVSGGVQAAAAKQKEAAGTERADTAVRILPRRVAKIRIAKRAGECCELHFVYDGQGRIAAVRRTELGDGDDRAWHKDGETVITYAADRVTATGADGEAVYGLSGGRAVEAAASWHETPEFAGESAGTYSYDGCGYLAGSTYENENVEYAESYEIVDGAFVGMKRDVEGQELAAEHENDPGRLNNLNIDLFGLSEFVCCGNYAPVLLYGIGGRRVRTLPVKIVCRWTGSADEPEYRTYAYEMAGEYIAAVEICDERGERMRLEFHYEE